RCSHPVRSTLAIPWSGSSLRPLCPVVSCCSRRRTSSRALVPSVTTWKASNTSTASSSRVDCRAVLYPAKGSIAASSIPAVNPVPWARNHAVSTGLERPGTRSNNRGGPDRSEEHTSELQSRFELISRLLLEKKENKNE